MFCIHKKYFREKHSTIALQIPMLLLLSGKPLCISEYHQYPKVSSHLSLGNTGCPIQFPDKLGIRICCTKCVDLSLDSDLRNSIWASVLKNFKGKSPKSTYIIFSLSHANSRVIHVQFVCNRNLWIDT